MILDICRCIIGFLVIPCCVFKGLPVHPDMPVRGVAFPRAKGQMIGVLQNGIIDDCWAGKLYFRLADIANWISENLHKCYSPESSNSMSLRWCGRLLWRELGAWWWLVKRNVKRIWILDYKATEFQILIKVGRIIWKFPILWFLSATRQNGESERDSAHARGGPMRIRRWRHFNPPIQSSDGG